MAKRSTRGPKPKQVETLKHDAAKRRNVPTAELASAFERMEETDPQGPVTYPRARPLAEGETRQRDEDLDPQIVWKGATLSLSPEQIAQLTETGRLEIGEAELTWRGKDQQDWSDLVVQTPPLYIQEKVHPKAIINDLKRHSDERAKASTDAPDLFDDIYTDFNGIDPEAKTEFYAHDQNWQNRMILGDSLQVMASLAEREALRGKVQCIYFDPPYGIRFNSNWQVSTRSRDVKDGKLDQITREPEQVKAFRDTWKDGIHSYLTYLRDRLTVMRDLLTESGSIFVQIGDENVHRVRALMDEVFAEENFVSEIRFKKTSGTGARHLDNIHDSILWYSKHTRSQKFRRLFAIKSKGLLESQYTLVDEIKSEIESATAKFMPGDMSAQGASESGTYPFEFQGEQYSLPQNTHWKASRSGMPRLSRAGRLIGIGKRIRYKRFGDDWPVVIYSNSWDDTIVSGYSDPKLYIVQTSPKVVERCILMATDPGDLVLDPTCGSGTTAYVAEQWGRRWITLDTSRVSLALARTRLMSTRYPYYKLADSPEGRAQEQKLTGEVRPDTPTHGDIRQGFVYERAPHITLKSIANNAEIDVIWETWQETLEPLRADLNRLLEQAWEEWEIPRDAGDPWPEAAQKLHADILKAQAEGKNVAAPLKKLNEVLKRAYTPDTLPEKPVDPWPDATTTVHAAWWEARIARQKEIDESIARKADVELLYDRPYEDKTKVRVAGPFTVESLSPHRVMPSDEDDGLLEGDRAQATDLNDFTSMILENLKTAGVHQAKKNDRITFTAIEGWPGTYIAAEGHFQDGNRQQRAAIFIGPEFGTVTRADLTAAAREANDARFDALIACGFNFDAHSSEISHMGPLPILKAKMNQDLHMSDELKNTGKGNLFTIIGEPDIEWGFDAEGEITVRILGLDVFDLKTGDIRSSEKDDIAAWFIDTDYDEESFFVRHAYFLGANDPYKQLKTSLKAEIDQEAWETLYRDISRPFPRPQSGRFAVKVINHFGDEVMKVFSV
jgi:adenine-specific DNA-methyltransferase